MGAGDISTGYSLPSATTVAVPVAVAMKVFVDGKLCGTVLNPPYKVTLGELSPGKHLLEVEVFNAGGNRDKLAGQPAGMLGSAVLVKSLH